MCVSLLSFEVHILVSLHLSWCVPPCLIRCTLVPPLSLPCRCTGGRLEASLTLRCSQMNCCSQLLERWSLLCLCMCLLYIRLCTVQCVQVSSSVCFYTSHCLSPSFLPLISESSIQLQPIPSSSHPYLIFPSVTLTPHLPTHRSHPSPPHCRSNSLTWSLLSTWETGHWRRRPQTLPYPSSLGVALPTLTTSSCQPTTSPSQRSVP